MKIPKTTKRYCPKCNTHTDQKISLVSSGHKKGSLRRGSISRAKKRGLGRGHGNLGKWGSKPPVTQFKSKIKTTKKTNLKYTCSKCKKSIVQRKGMRAGKVVLEDAVK